MKIYIKKLLVITGLICGLLTLGLATHQAHAQVFDNGTTNEACQGVAAGTSGTGCDTTAQTKLNNTLANAINIFSAIIGFVSVIMIMVGGFKYITSGGDSGAVNSAKNTIIYACVGVVFVVMAQVLVHFVIVKSG